MTIHPLSARITRLAGAALALLLATAPSAMAACKEEGGLAETRDLRNCDLSGMDLSGLDLRDADLSGANLYGANLYGANLTGVTWTNGRRCSPRSTDGECLRRSCTEAGCAANPFQ